MQANIAAYDAVLQPGDSVITTPCRHGGHYSHNKDGPLRLYRPRLLPIPFDEHTYNIDTQGLYSLIRKEQPKLLVIGWSEFLFPHPLSQIREVCDKYGTRIMYDMSHVAGLIAGGEFQADAGRMADIVSSSTGKSLHAPDHGLCLYNDDHLTGAINRAVQPLLTSNTHPHEIAALGVALVEMKTFGKDYAKQVIQNAKSLGRSLANKGVHVLYGSQGYTESHTILVQLKDTRSKDYVRLLDQAGITVNLCALPWDKEGQETGLRLGISSVIVEGLDVSMVFNELVKPLAEEFDGIAYAFDTSTDPLAAEFRKKRWSTQASKTESKGEPENQGPRKHLHNRLSSYFHKWK
jgi:glycine hydroxymethyltransferase